MAIRLGIVVSEFHHEVTHAMLERAREHAEFLGAEILTEIKVPGVFEIPLGAEKLLEREDVDAVVTLGTVIEGETDHDTVVMQHAARKIIDLGLEYKKPVGLGISGPKITRLQALERVDSYAKRAVESAVKMVKRIQEI